MRIPSLSAASRIFAACGTGMTRPSTPSKPAAFMRVEVVFGRLGDQRLVQLRLEVERRHRRRAAPAGVTPAARVPAGACAAREPAPRPSPVARPAEDERKSRRFTVDPPADGACASPWRHRAHHRPRRTGHVGARLARHGTASDRLRALLRSILLRMSGRFAHQHARTSSRARLTSVRSSSVNSRARRGCCGWRRAGCREPSCSRAGG